LLSFHVVFPPSEARRSSGEVPIGKQSIRVWHEPLSHSHSPAIKEYLLQPHKGDEICICVSRSLKRTPLKSSTRDDEATMRTGIRNNGPERVHDLLQDTTRPEFAFTEIYGGRYRMAISCLNVDLLGPSHDLKFLTDLNFTANLGEHLSGHCLQFAPVCRIAVEDHHARLAVAA
jgi:hypothetical protein